MIHLEQGIVLEPPQKLALAIDTENPVVAENYVKVAKDCGGLIVKFGYEMGESKSQWCSELAHEYGMVWIADYKYYAISKSMAAPINRLVELRYPPVGITISTHSNLEGIRIAQEIANRKQIIIFGAAILSAISEEEAVEYDYRTPKQIILAHGTKAENAGAKGMVASGKELSTLKRFRNTRKLATLVVGTRSKGVVIEGDDQQRITTIEEAVRNGGDIIEIGRQVTQAKDMSLAYDLASQEVERGMAA